MPDSAASQTLAVRFIADTGNLSKGLDGLTGRFRSVVGGLKSIATLAAGVGTISFMKKAIEEAREAEKVTRQTAAVIKSTGGDANVTAKHVDNLANKISKYAGVDDEAIASGENLLLTFRNIKNQTGKNNDIFDQATIAAVNMSAALHKDLGQSAIMVGKALNDPVKGINAMTRAGVSFSDQQKKQIKDMVASGDTMGAQKIILRELQGEFGGMAAASADSGMKAKVAWDNMAESIGLKVMPLFNQAAVFLLTNVVPAIGQMASSIWSALGPAITQIGAWIRDNVIPAIAALIGWGRDVLWPFMVTMWQAIASSVWPVIQAIGTFLINNAIKPLIAILQNVVGPVLQAVSGFFDQHRWIIGLAASAVAGMVAALLAFNGVMMIVRGVIAVVTAVQLAWNAVLAANPITLVVLALGALVGAFIYAWNHSATFRDILINVWQGVQNAASVAWSILSAIFNGIVTAARAVWDFFVMVGHGIEAAWNGMVNGIGAAWNWLNGNVFQPIGAALSWLHGFFQSVGAAIGAAWQAMVNGISAAWGWMNANVFRPIGDALNWLHAFFQSAGAAIGAAWQAMVNGIHAIWQWMDANVFRAIGNALNWLRDFFQAAGAAIGAAWQAMVNGIHAIWNWLNSNVFQPIGAALNALAGVFQSIGAAIGNHWKTMGDGIVWVWNSILHPAFDAIGKAAQAIGDAFVWMKDRVVDIWNKLGDIIKKPIQFVIDVVWNNSIRWFVNKVASFLGMGEPLGGPIRLAGGGVLPGYQPGRDSVPAMLSPGEAVLVPELVRQIGPGNILAANRAASGRRSGSGGHFAGGGIVGDIMGAIGGVGGEVANFLTNPYQAVKSKIGSLGTWGEILAKIPVTILEKFGHWAWEKIKGMLTIKSEQSGTASAGVNIGGSGVTRWAGLVTEVLNELHQNGFLVPHVLRRMNQESGGNPTIVNNWDSNAKKGTPSKGLMQVIDPTFRAYAGPYLGRGIFDPKANIYAGLNYALHRYPSLQYAMDKPGGYAGGGIVPKVFDNGGVWRSGELGINTTGHDEYVVNPKKTSMGGKNYHLHMTVSNHPVDVAQQFKRMELMAGDL